jgi:outer membrane receptor for ferric coprogen and ferric-rhodotorulic acid
MAINLTKFNEVSQDTNNTIKGYTDPIGSQYHLFRRGNEGVTTKRTQMTKRHNRKCSTDGGKMIRYICTSLLAGLAVSGLSAQSEDEEDVFLLDPFEVSADSQTGYIATTAVTATKVGTLIKNTPLNIQVMTSEFLEDTAMLNFEDITKYSSSFSQDSVNGSNFNSVLNAGQRGNTVAASGITGEGRVGLNPPNSIRLRAFPISNILRNGLPRAGNHSLKGVDRVEIVKGPVAIFFGQSQPGGAINYVTKRPIDQFRFKATTRAGQFSLKAVEIDANVPISKNLGIRILSSYQDGEDWRQFSSGTEKYIAGIVKLELFDRITLVLEGERLERSYNPGGSPIVTNALYHNDYFNPPDEILFLPQDSEYGRNPWNRGFGREDTLRRWQATILRNRDNWINARNAAFPEEGYPR